MTGVCDCGGRTRPLLAQGRNVIVDATHARRKWRRNEIDIARARRAHVVGVWFNVSLADCLARNADRPGGGWGDRVVPDDLLEWVWRGFEQPEPGEFDEVWQVSELPAPIPPETKRSSREAGGLR
jgi:predicted kinase